MHRRLIIAAAVVTAGLCAAACGSSGGTERPERPRSRDIKLPRATFPRFVTVTKDGSVWVSESSANAIARIDRRRRITHHPIGTDEASPGELVPTPDGSIWFPGFLFVARVTPEGDVKGFAHFGPNDRPEVGLPEAMTLGPDKNIWYTDEGGSKITRLTPDGRFLKRDLPAGDKDLSLTGITAGPDGAVWFTESATGEDEHAAIGRMELDGSYRRFPLPKRPAGPARITTGPDGALWFTERSGYRIGRITTSGKISEYALPPGTSPFDITAGDDGALWFTTDKKLGRITVEGGVKLYAIPGARSLVGLDADGNGGLWIADSEADVVRHFKP